MSLYAVEKFLYEINRNLENQNQYLKDCSTLLNDYELDAEEYQAIYDGDIGKLYVLGCNGQLLMHFGALLGLSWPEYIKAMLDGVVKYGPVRAGIYAQSKKTEATS